MEVRFALIILVEIESNFHVRTLNGRLSRAGIFFRRSLGHMFFVIVEREEIEKHVIFSVSAQHE